MTVYFVRAGKDGPVKIGHTGGSVLRRVAQMQIGSPVPIVLLGITEGGREEERALQIRFEANHLRGEWFIVDPELADYLAFLEPPPKSPKHLRGFRKGGNSVPFNPDGYQRGRDRTLSKEQLMTVKGLIENSDLSLTEIAKRYDVARSTIQYHFPTYRTMRKQPERLGRRTRIKPEQFAEIERLLLEDKLTIPQIGKRFKIAGSTVNHHFPGWRGKTPAERRAHRREYPLPVK